MLNIRRSVEYRAEQDDDTLNYRLICVFRISVSKLLDYLLIEDSSLEVDEFVRQQKECCLKQIKDMLYADIRHQLVMVHKTLSLVPSDGTDYTYKAQRMLAELMNDIDRA